MSDKKDIYRRRKAKKWPGDRVELPKLTPLCATTMGQAIAFVLLLVAFGIFMPDVLHALSTFLLVLLTKSTAFVNALPTNSAVVSQAIGHY